MGSLENIEMLKKISFPSLKIKQPIGEFYIGVISAKDLNDIAWVDVRRMANEDGEIDKYLGIQRKLSDSRISELKTYVKTHDATFPTSIILSVPTKCAIWDDSTSKLTLQEYINEDNPEENIEFSDIAKILDGQHRLRGLSSGLNYDLEYAEQNNIPFELSVAIFVGADIAQQATIFATVNLAQTKVNKSLVYDLAELSKIRSPQKSCHYIAVALDEQPASPLFQTIKRLGIATPGRSDAHETLTQATFVEALMPYVSRDPVSDREFLKNHPAKRLPNVTDKEKLSLIFRGLYIEEKEQEIAKIVWAYFAAIQQRWPNAWVGRERGNIIKRTNGFKAFMKFLKPAYLSLAGPQRIGVFVSKSEFLEIFNKITIDEADFSSDTFPPGTSGEAKLLKKLLEDSGLSR